MQKLIEFSKKGGPLEGLTKEDLVSLGEELEFFPGVPEGLIALRDELSESSEFRDAGIRLEFYVISAGIGDMLRASILSKFAHRIWACDFAYDSEGTPVFVKNVISFTDKTRFLYMVNKGKVSEQDATRQYVVNEPMDEPERPVPFKNMIYIGDGPTDVPSMSLVQSKGGLVIGILGKDKPDKAWAIGYGRRANVTVPPEFSVGQYGYDYLKEAVLKIGGDIRSQIPSSGLAPSH